jgi:hypothetical protein
MSEQTEGHVEDCSCCDCDPTDWDRVAEVTAIDDEIKVYLVNGAGRGHRCACRLCDPTLEPPISGHRPGFHNTKSAVCGPTIDFPFYRRVAVLKDGVELTHCFAVDLDAGKAWVWGVRNGSRHLCNHPGVLNAAPCCVVETGDLSVEWVKREIRPFRPVSA